MSTICEYVLRLHYPTRYEHDNSAINCTTLSCSCGLPFTGPSVRFAVENWITHLRDMELQTHKFVVPDTSTKEESTSDE